MLNFKFISYTPLNTTHNILNKNDTPYLTIKQTYLLLAWFKYSHLKKLTKYVGFFVFPRQKYTFTSVKAPIAHKNWSKEQFKFQYFTYVLSFQRISLHSINSFDTILFFLLSLSNNFVFFETNFFFLKSYTIVLNTSQNYY